MGMFKELRDLSGAGKQKPKDDLAQANEAPQAAQSDEAAAEKPADEDVDGTAPESQARSTRTTTPS